VHQAAGTLIVQLGVSVAERLHLDVAQAFTLLRNGSRNSNRRLSDFAQAIVDGSELSALT
jgi:hypothetical protein